jgi:hypothetical protein
VGAWLPFGDEASLAKWKRRCVESAAFEDWPEILDGPAGAPDVDELTIGKLLAAMSRNEFVSGRGRTTFDGSFVRIAGASTKGRDRDVGAGATRRRNSSLQQVARRR